VTGPSAPRRPRLPLATWAGVLSSLAVVTACAFTALNLHLHGALSPASTQAVVTGAAAGLAVALSTVVLATRVSAAVRDLLADAVRRLREPSAGPAAADRPGVVQRSSELAELARVLDALHLQLRLADEVGERHRRDAENVGAGVFELVSGLVAAEEGARGQLAAELHDTVAQSLMLARSLLASWPGDPVDLMSLSDHVEDAEEQLRGVMFRTRPPALREGDLASAVSGLRSDMQARYGLSVHVEWPQTPLPLPLASAVTVYRFFQEALLNVVKHSDVDDATLRLEVTGRSVIAIVRDEGPGFDLSSVRPEGGRHVGLGLLRERARLSGGTLDIESAIGGGTTLSLQLPRSNRLPRPRQEDVAAGVVPAPRAATADAAAPLR
jgi:signal transduction histidine kinase